MAAEGGRFDPLLMAVLSRRLEAIIREMSNTVMRASRSKLERHQASSRIGDLAEHLGNERIANRAHIRIHQGVHLWIGICHGLMNRLVPCRVQPFPDFAMVHQKFSQADSRRGVRVEWHRRTGASTRRQSENRRSYRSVR